MEPLTDGAITLGRYQLLYELASGGMATAYVARAQGAAGFERLVVIKRVHGHLLENREFYKMFVDEAKVASLVRHPNVVPVIDVVEAEGELFLVMEYIESVSLAVLLGTARARGVKVPPPIASRILVDTLGGLHAAHEALDMAGQPLGIVHRDVSPQNIVVGVDGASRLIDFGIAKAAGRLTKTTGGVMKGKMGYMAPEQAKARPVDRRADVYAAGVVLFEALSGQRLFAGADAADILLNMLVAEIPDVTSVVPDLPRQLDDVVHMALASHPDERFDNASAFQVALETALPPAPVRDVGKLVREWAGEVLTTRREALREAVAASRPELGPPPDDRPAASAKTTVREETPPRALQFADEPVTDISHAGVPKPLEARRVVAVGAVAIVAIGAAIAILSTSSSGPETERPVPSAPLAAPTGRPDGRAPAPSATATSDPSGIVVAPAGDPSEPSDASEPASAAPPPSRRVAPSPPSGGPRPPPPPPRDPGLQENPY